MGELLEPIIIDTGSFSTVVGSGNETTDQKEFPTIVGRFKKLNMMAGMGRKDTYVGKEAQLKRGILIMKQPYLNGKVHNWDDIEMVWQHAFKSKLKMVPEEHPVALTDNTFTSKKHRQQTTQIMFETFNVPCLYIGNSAAMSLYNSDLTTGLVLEMGEDRNCVVPIYQMSCMHHYAKVSGVGGSFLTAHLLQILSSLGFNLRSPEEKETVREIKEKFGIVFPQTNKSKNKELNESDLNLQSNRVNKETVNTKNLSQEKKRTVNYKLPDGQILDLSERVFFVTIPLFDPKLVKVGIDFLQLTYKTSDFPEPKINPEYYEKGIHELTFETIKSLPEELQNIMFQNIVLSGGNSMFKGLQQRLINELDSFFAENKPKIEVIAPQSRQYSSFNGCKKFSKLNNFSDYCIHLKEYEEFGPILSIRKFC
ncbi:actin-10-related [Anaeramoeba flamelloides]|uniref:Actin-10-related n=1 Tax=Anaeramoeba flamelloides TaxID=1746091 RepID=A0ABQ8XKY8_9EUKA|nr:actin-10-related [Anaeramoeba flamelloides]